MKKLKDTVIEVAKNEHPYPDKNTFTSKKMTEQTLQLYFQLCKTSS